MAKKPELRRFTVQSWVTVLVGLPINAESFEHAMEQAKKLDTLDYVKIKGEYSDGKAPLINWISDDSAQPPD